MLRFCSLIVAVAFLVGPLHGRQQPIVASDMLLIRTVTSIDVAADGSRAVFAVRSIDADDDADNGEVIYSYRSHLFLADLARESPPRQLTFGKRNDRSPQLSPDGRHIAFLRGGEDEQSAQVWILPVDGGESWQLTSLPHAARSLEWSPNGRRLLVSAQVPMSELDGQPVWPMERPARQWDDAADDEIMPGPDGSREQIRAWLNRNARDQNPVVINRLEFQDEQSLRGEMKFTHLFLIEAHYADAQPVRITDGFYDHEDAAFMPDGRRVVYSAKKPEDRHPDRVNTTELWVTQVNGGQPRRLLTLPNWRLSSPRPSPDGTVVAFTGQMADEPSYRQWQLGIVPADGESNAEPVWLTDQNSYDYSVRSIEWMPTRSAIAFLTAREGGFPLMMISPGLLTPTALIDQHHGMSVGVHRFGVGGGAVVYTMTSPQNPCQLRVRDARGDRLLMDLNPWTADRALSIPTEGWITRPDGKRVQYWLMEPTGRVDGQTYPLVLQIHGGPQVMWGPGEASMWHEFQLMCSWGYGVVFANPRGSSGYGYAFQRANYQNWGEGPAGDVLAAVDQAMLNEWVDRDRLLITGGSYAGYLTAWIVAHDHRFKAAVAQRGVYHLPTFFGEGNAWRLVPRAMGGVPSDSRVRQVIDRESPFTYVSRIRTPLLIMHGSEDLRTGVSQSEMMYRALKYLERPVEYVRYPGAGHDLSRSGPPRQRLDRLNRIIEFFERHIENPRPAPGSTPGSTPGSAPGRAAETIPATSSEPTPPVVSDDQADRE